MSYFIFFLISFILSLIITPLAIRLALKYKIVDNPNNLLKTHTKVTPYLGGLSIYVSFVITIVILIWLTEELLSIKVIGFIISFTLVFLLGLIDDIKQISPKAKMLGQIVAAIIFILFVGSTNLFNNVILDCLFTIFWLVGLSNAVNLIDIMDGLSSGTVVTIGLSLGVILILSGNIIAGIFALILAGSSLGFLKYNFNPAKIFMGDAGSLFLGFVLAGIISITYWDAFDFYSLLVPILICIVPIGETVFLIIMRLKAGRSPLLGSKDHFALRLRKLGLSVRKITIITYLFSISYGILGAIIIHLINLNQFFSLALLLIGVIVILSVGYFLSKIDMSEENKKLDEKIKQASTMQV
ncbi:hypothetical protein B4064_1763 [Caldibacillus thermoamylovorans]|uniref:glycosyltransferase family 4 protein n=1 Tax=Caldibacillus thermoamylovorans TaxID=35841 RepID=UPI0005B74B84|nr:MraY family glycosyltransferase [Caldibacillus thermoamylovorans]KIO68273.1 hypothetical protein B4064_1763 [Caldibacillus thermoamylovorans]